MERHRLTPQQVVALATPPALIATMIPAFRWLVRRLGWPRGYLAGFFIYWLGWCTALPLVLLGGRRRLLNLFREGDPGIKHLSWKTQLALWWPIFFPLAFVIVPMRRKITGSLLWRSLLLGVAIGVTEETLWRGVYIRLFPDNAWLNTLYPSLGFALWHLAPQGVYPNRQPGGQASFLLYSFVLGLSYAYYARRTGSIRWCTVSHVVHDSLGLGARIY